MAVRLADRDAELEITDFLGALDPGQAAELQRRSME
jgi:hypothetical protein